MKESGLPVENDLAYLRNGSQVNTVENNKSVSSQIIATESSASNVSPEEAWKTRYDNIMEDIAKSNNMDERRQKVNFYNNELSTMKDSGLPVDNDLAYLRVQLGQKVYPTPVNEILNQSPMIAENIKNNEVLDAVINHSDKINKKEVALGALQGFGGFTESSAGALVAGASGGLAAVGGVYMVGDGISNGVGGASKMLNGLKGLDSSNGGGDTANFVKSGYKAILPHDGILSGENVYNGTQVLIAGKTIKDGIIGLPKAVEKVEDLFTHGGSLVGKTIDISIPKVFEKVGEIGVDMKNGSDAKDGLSIPESTFDVQGYLDSYIKISGEIENKLGLSQNNNQQGKCIAR